MIRAEFTEEQPQYKYMQLDENIADIIVYSFVEKRIDEQYMYSVIDTSIDENFLVDVENEFIDDSFLLDNKQEPTLVQQTMYVYNINMFRCSSNDITENMVKNDLAYYLHYNPDNKQTFEEMQNDINIDVDYRLSMLELGI